MVVKKKKKTRSKLIKELDAIFSRYIRLLYADKKWMVMCYTCWKKEHWKKAQNGHFISRKYLISRRDVENCRVQCVWCNIFKSWNYIEYTRKMIDEKWREFVEHLVKQKKKIYKIKTYELEEMIKEYKEKVEKLLIEKGIKDK